MRRREFLKYYCRDGGGRIVRATGSTGADAATVKVGVVGAKTGSARARRGGHPFPALPALGARG